MQGYPKVYNWREKVYKRERGFFTEELINEKLCQEIRTYLWPYPQVTRFVSDQIWKPVLILCSFHMAPPFLYYVTKPITKRFIATQPSSIGFIHLHESKSNAVWQVIRYVLLQQESNFPLQKRYRAYQIQQCRVNRRASWYRKKSDTKLARYPVNWVFWLACPLLPF